MCFIVLFANVAIKFLLLICVVVFIVLCLIKLLKIILILICFFRKNKKNGYGQSYSMKNES